MNTIIKRSGVLAALAMASVCVFAQDGQIRVIVNGEDVHFGNVQPEEVDGRVLVPMRGVFESIGADVHWNSSTETVRVDRREHRVEVQIGSHRATIDGREVNLDVPPTLVADTTLVPLRFITEALGADVDWRPTEMTVAVSTVRHEQEPRRVADVTVERELFPANLHLRILLDDPISSRRSERGDRFVATVVSENGEGRDFQDAKIVGVIEHAGGAIEGAPGMIRIRLTAVRFPDGREVPISGRIIASNETHWAQADDGTLMADNRWYRHHRNNNIDLAPGTELEVQISRSDDQEYRRPRRREMNHADDDRSDSGR